MAALAPATACLLSLPATALSLDDLRAPQALRSRFMTTAPECGDHAPRNSVFDRCRVLLSHVKRFLRTRHGVRHDRWVTEKAKQDSRCANSPRDDVCADDRPLAAALSAPAKSASPAALARVHQIGWRHP